MGDAKVEGALSHGICSPFLSMIVKWIAPKKIIQYSLWRNLPKSVYQLDFPNFFEVWGNPSMHCEILLIDHCAQREHLEGSHDFIVHLLIVFAQT